jgi:hypothetical protein
MKEFRISNFGLRILSDAVGTHLGYLNFDMKLDA